jgi:hypothetical protein
MSGLKNKTRKNRNLSLSDYRKILKFYKMNIPKSSSKLVKEGDKIIAEKFCSCIKKVRAKFKKEGIAIGICTKSVITRKGYKRGEFKCKKRRSIKLYKGGSKYTKKKRGGQPAQPFVFDWIFKVGACKTTDPEHQAALERLKKFMARLKVRTESLTETGKNDPDDLDEMVELLTSPITVPRPNPKVGDRLTSPITVPRPNPKAGDSSTSPITVPNPKEGGNKSKKIKEIIDIFKQYPDIFPSGYFRFLPATLDKHDKKGTLIYKNGVVLTYTKYKKTVNKYKIKPGDVKLNQLVNKNQGNGRAKKIFLKFMKKHKDSNLLLDVLASNKRAIKFYKKNGFKKIANTKFGDKLKGIVMLKHTKKNKTRKKKN